MPLIPVLSRTRRPLAAVLVLAAGLGAAHAAPAPTGKPVVLDGELDVRVEDYRDGHSRTRQFLKTNHGRVELSFHGKPALLPSGSRVRVRGNQSGPILYLNGADTGSVQSLATTGSSSLGEQKAVVLLVNFQDDTSQPFSIAQANDAVFNTIDRYYQDASFGQTWLKGQTYGWFTVAMSRNTCDPDLMVSLADQAATASGIDVASYPRKIYVFPTNVCQWSGQGNVGGSSTRVWSNGSLDTLVIGHELGHNLGLYHAQALNCDTAPMGGTCTTLQYGDAPDLMGNYRAGAFNAFEKERMGWLNDGVSPPILTASTSGRYTIEPYSASTVGAKAIKIPRGLDGSGRQQWYYLEYRQASGPDAVLAGAGNGNLTQGVIVRTGTSGDPQSSRQLDMTPGTSTNTHTELADGALAPGLSYVDSVAGVTITVVSVGTTGAVVDVAISGSAAPTCTHAAPTLSLSGPTTAVAPGTAVTYTVNLSNTDSAACPATTFALARTVPSGWTGTLGVASLSLSAGASGSTTLTVTSPATAADGSYGIGVGASSSVSSAHNASASANTVVGGTLTDAVGTDKTSYVRGETAALSALVKRNGSPVAGASVTFTVTLPGGSTATRSATSGSDGYARSTYAIGKGKAAIGSYGVRAQATLGGGSASATSSFNAR